MQKTIFAILTNKKARSGRAVEKVLDEEFTAGAPWLDKIHTEPPIAKIDVAS